ncbi:amidase [Faunimonas pinastri]|uniref:Amidase n=1 Tax=Faunimonas pinastri TaxID=1855383 RepID=A0A1H9NNI4_9HYPH|nr:amidase [Faunimonas pinastri]SER36933.1 amidase [Faunimonas pinastri]
MSHDQLAYRSARALSRSLANREMSARELLEASIARIEALDGRLNAVVVRDFERARNAADAADAALARGERRPLTGLPITIKESFDVEGLPTTWGVPAFRDSIARRDADPVARLRAAGAIILGKTNVSEFLDDWQSVNPLFGATSNPYDLDRTAGGSSGGAAAALAAGFVSLEIGSDIGGSIRVPAHFCGLFGHQPSFPLVAHGGHALGRVARLDLSVPGPLARTAGDLALALDMLAGPDAEHAGAFRFELPPARHEAIGDFRVLVIDQHPLFPTDPSVRDALDQLASKLERAGATVRRKSDLLPDLGEAARLYATLLASALSAGRPPQFYREMEAEVASLDGDDHSLRACRLRGTLMRHHEWIDANEARARLRHRWAKLFEAFDVVLCPPFSTPAYRKFEPTEPKAERRIVIDGEEADYIDQSVWSGLATAPGLPASVAPTGLGPEGLPIGVQIIGPYMEDRTPIRFAELLEEAFGGFVPPPAFP